MRPVEHFLSLLDRLEGSGDAEVSEDRLIREFTGLAAPVIGPDAAGDLCADALDRLKTKRPLRYRKLGFIAAFLLGDFDDGSMELDEDDWEDIRETLEDVSTGMNLETLTKLMGELLSRGKLGKDAAS
jgi:hypothetical protein